MLMVPLSKNFINDNVHIMYISLRYLNLTINTQHDNWIQYF